MRNGDKYPLFDIKADRRVFDLSNLVSLACIDNVTKKKALLFFFLLKKLINHTNWLVLMRREYHVSTDNVYVACKCHSLATLTTYAATAFS